MQNRWNCPSDSSPKEQFSRSNRINRRLIKSARKFYVDTLGFKFHTVAPMGPGVHWTLYVMHPRLDVAIARDSHRADWVAGPERVKQLHAKFTGEVFEPVCFIDNSDETPEETMARILQVGARLVQ